MSDEIICPWCHNQTEGFEDTSVCDLCHDEPLSPELHAAYLLVEDEFTALLHMRGPESLRRLDERFDELRRDVLGGVVKCPRCGLWVTNTGASVPVHKKFNQSSCVLCGGLRTVSIELASAYRLLVDERGEQLPTLDAKDLREQFSKR